MSNNKQALELTDITAPLLAATQGFTMKDRDASTTTPITDETTIGFLLDCAERGENRGNQRPPSICKVSRILRDDNESFFIPQLVSIGPIHSDDPKLKEFEWLKECYLDDLLKRCEDSTPKEILEAYLLEVSTLIPQIRESYAGVIKNYSDADLARMMVMDGCFILEFCFKHESRNWHLPKKMQTRRIAMDLILLENQVPFFVLQALFDCSMGKVTRKGPDTLSQVLDAYLAPYIKLFRYQICHGSDVVSDSTPAHVLGYLHKRYQLVAAKSSKAKDAEASKLVDEEQAAESSNPIEDTAFHSIVELDRSGTEFKPHQEYSWSMTVKFQLSPFFPSLTPTLLMPTLLIHGTTELIFRNFIAYEQLFPQDHYNFTSYAHAMDMLIDTQEDIAKLVESKVLVNMLGSNQEAADMINKICKNISITDFYYTQEFKQMDKYYNRVFTKMTRIISNDPARYISQCILFYLSLIQTIYTIRAA